MIVGLLIKNHRTQNTQQQQQKPSLSPKILGLAIDID